MGALLELKQEGKIRAIGVSNATAAQMQEYADVGPLDTDQEKYSMSVKLYSTMFESKPHF